MKEFRPNKVYIVTEGEYSDYYIAGVFLDEVKARNFAKFHQANVEEYEFDDDNYELVVTGYWCVTTRIEACKQHGPKPFFTKRPPKTDANLTEKKKENGTSFLLDCYADADKYDYNDNITLYVTRCFPESVGEENARAQAEKIAYDIFAEINNHIVEGEDVEDVINLMKEKYERC